MREPLSQIRARTLHAISLIRKRAAQRWSVAAPGVALLILSVLGVATFGNLPEARGAIRHYVANARAALFAEAGDTVTVFGPRQFVTVQSKIQINFAESFSVPASSTPNATEYTLRLKRVGGNLSTATVTINGVQVATVANFGTATTISRRITLNQTSPNTNSFTLALKGDAGAGIIVTIFGTPNKTFDIFGPKVYTKTAVTPTRYDDSFVLPAGASPPYHIIVKPSVTATKAVVYLNGVKLILEAGDCTGVPDADDAFENDDDDCLVNLVSGTNTLRVDVSGTTGTTITVTLTAKGNTKPVITITSPPVDLVTNSPTLAVTGSVQDIVPATVKVNGVAASMSGPGNTQYAATIPLTEGSNTVLITATNQFSNRTDSTRTVIRDTQAPTLTLTSPADGSYTNQVAATVSGTVGGGGTTVTVKVNGVSFPVGGGGTFSGSYQLTAGANFLTAVATDQAGNNASVTNKVTLDTDAPVLTISAPAEGAITKQTSLAVSGTVTDASPTTVTVNGVSAPVGSNGSFAVTVPLGADGSNAINVIATDAASNQSTASRNVIRDTASPVVTIAAPAEGFLTNHNTVSVSGTVTDATAVTLTVNGATLAVGAGGNFTGEVPLATEGANAIAFVATDAATNQSTQSRNVTRDTQAPVVTLSSPTEGLLTKESSVEVIGTVTDASPTTVTVNGVDVPVGANGSFTATVLVNEGPNAVTVVATDGATNQSSISRNVVRDSQAPVVTITAPAEGFVTNTNSISVSGTVADASAVTLSVNGVTIAVDASGNFAGEVPLGAEGPNTIAFTATDAAGNSAAPAVSVRRDSEAPVLNVTAPTDNSITRTNTVSIAGNVYDASPVAVSVNGAPVVVDGTGNLSGSVALAEGQNILTVVATDGAGNTASQVRRVTLDTQAPVITINAPSNGASVVTASVATTGTVTDATTTSLTVNGAPFTLGAGGAFSGDVALTTGQNTVSYAATDAAGNVGTASRSVTRAAAGPPDPVAVATPVNQAEVTLMQENTAFLYAGANPVQTGVAPGTIAFLRSAVMRGRVLDRTLAPLGDVAVTIKDHPELGRTTTRSDGRYDLAVNGGGTLVVDFAKGGYLPAQRGVAVPWQDYTIVGDVVLLQPDAAVTTVDLTSNEITVAQSSVQTDADGPRHATVFFEPGTQATLRRADGTTQILTSLDIRATEFTVGTNGGKAMPGELPPSSQYTYAVQVTADQQLAAGPGAVLTFSQPVPLYVENFLDFPVGTAVPTGVYNPAAGLWQPRPNGVVLKILGKDAQNRAILDINGDGVADSDSLLAFNGIDPLERIKLAGTYPLGSALWRVPIIESLPHDLNWPYVLVGGTPPLSKVTGPCGSEGADVMRCSLQVQTAFQSVGIVGSPFTLNYASDRTQGNVSDRKLEIKLVGDTIPSFLERVDLEIDIAGKRFEASFLPMVNLSYTFVWDGKDAYGRTVQATQPASLRISYMYPVLYGVPAPVQQSFGLPCMITVGGCQLAADTRESIRALRRVAETLQTTLGAFDATGAGLGGFTLNVQHAYDPIGGQFYAGDGTRRVAATLPDQVTRWAGTGSAGTAGSAIVNDVPKTQSIVSDPQGIVAAPDGSVYIADFGRSRIRKVGPDGIITTVAGRILNGAAAGYNGDNIPATTAQLNNPRALALGTDGSLYIGETGRHAIRRIGPDGIIRAVAGDGTCGFTGDNGLATSARVCNVKGMGIAPDGSLYFTDSQNQRIRKIGPDGIIRTVAGTGGVCFRGGNLGQIAPAGEFEKTPALGGCGEGIPATRATLQSPTGLTVGPDGTVYFAQQSGGIYASRIRRIDPAGFIYTFAGADVAADKLNEGGSAKQAQLAGLTFSGLTVGPDGSVYFSSINVTGSFPEQYQRVRRVHPDGRITTVIGDGLGTSGTVLGDIGAARRARIGWVDGLTFNKAGDLLVSDDAEVRLVSAPLPGLAAGQAVIASQDGSELYVFSPAGRILLTLNAMTRDTVMRFSYDGNRKLISITDASHEVTHIERDGTGAAIAVVAPTGQRTQLAIGGGEVVTTGPDGHPRRFAFDGDGMLLGATDQNEHFTSYVYDASGQLTTTTAPNGGSQLVSVVPQSGGSRTTLTAAEGGTAVMQTQTLSSGGRELITTYPSGLSESVTSNVDGSTAIRTPDGMVVTKQVQGHPFFGMQAPLENTTMRTPSGLQVTRRQAAVVTLDTQTGELLAETDTTVVNGRTAVLQYNRVARTATLTSAVGRRRFTQLDLQGHVVRDSTPGVAAIITTYDSTGRMATRTQGSRVWRYAYDMLGRLAAVTDPAGRIQRYRYDAGDKAVARIGSVGDSTALAYDNVGSVTSLAPPSRPAHLFTYTDVNRLATHTAPDVGNGAGPMRVTHNLDGRVTRVVRPGGETIAYAYDSLGRLTTSTTPEGNVAFAYDATTGRARQITGPDGSTFAVTYDGVLPTRRTWSGPISGNVSTIFDNDFRAVAQRVNDANEVAFGYDGDGVLVTAGSLTLARDPANALVTGTTIGGVVSSFTYDAFSAAKGIAVNFGGSTPFDALYTRDSLGRVVEETETVAGVLTALSFRYDSAGRLVTVLRNGALDASYEYDPNGNRVRATTTSGVSVGTYDAQDRVLEYGTISYRYNQNGDLRFRINGSDTTTYRYSARGELLEVKLSNGTRIEYVLDPMGRRIGKKVDGVLVRSWLYDGEVGLAAELSPTGQVVSRFVYGSGVNAPEFMIKNGRTYRMIVDQLGSIRLVIDAQSGEVAQRLDFDAFGRVILNTNPGFQPFGFAGGLYDDDTRLVRFGARDYDAEVGRWTSPDPILFSGKDPNLYRYAGGDPVNHIDPSGLEYDLASLNVSLSVANNWMATRFMNGLLSAASGCGVEALNESLQGGDAGRACKRGAIEGGIAGVAGDVAGMGKLGKLMAGKNMCFLGAGMSLAFNFVEAQIGEDEFDKTDAAVEAGMACTTALTVPKQSSKIARSWLFGPLFSNLYGAINDATTVYLKAGINYYEKF